MTVKLGQHAARVFFHHDDAVGHEHGLFDVVRHHQHGLGGDGLVQPQFHQLAAQRLGAQHIQRAEWLVQAEQFRLNRHRARKAAFLAHPAGKLARVGRLESVQAHLVQQLQCLFASCGFRHAARFERHLDVLLHRQPRIQRKRLKDNRRVRVDAGERLPFVKHLAFARLDSAR